MRTLINTLLVLIAISPAAWCMHRTVSIVPKTPLPTAYGQNIVRSSDYLSQVVQEQAAQEPVDLAQIKAYVEQIEVQESRGGAYESDMVQTLQALGLAYKSRGDYPAAIDAFKRAMHLTRINNGLFAPEQVPLLRGIIDSRLSAGMFKLADEGQEYLYRVQRYNSNGEMSPALLEASREYSQWQRSVYLSGIGGDGYRRLLEMHEIHSQDIERIEAKNKNDPALIPHIYRLLNTEYLLSKYEGEKRPKFELNVRQHNNLAFPASIEEAQFKDLRRRIYQRGRKLLSRIAALRAGQSANADVELAKVKVQLGDWHQWFDLSARARESYEEAYAMLAENPQAAPELQKLFGEPVELPAALIFRPDPKLVPATLPGHALVSYKVSKSGRAKAIKVIELDPADHKGARFSLLRKLSDMRFRPRMEAGSAVATNAVEREYYFDY